MDPAGAMENANSGVSHSSLDGAKQRRRPQAPQARRRGYTRGLKQPKEGGNFR